MDNRASEGNRCTHHQNTRFINGTGGGTGPPRIPRLIPRVPAQQGYFQSQFHKLKVSSSEVVSRFKDTKYFLIYKIFRDQLEKVS